MFSSILQNLTTPSNHLSESAYHSLIEVSEHISDMHHVERLERGYITCWLVMESVHRGGLANLDLVQRGDGQIDRPQELLE